MASVINDKNQQEQVVTQTAQAPATTVTTTPTVTPAKTTLQGVSDNTAGMLNQYAQGYQQSSSVQAAQDYLNGVLNNKPVQDAQLSQLYDQIMNQEKFSYDLNGDALYHQYKDRYQNLGKQAMMNTMGNATALTGGYGSSYATTAGNQAYQQYLQQLNDVVPELYKLAYDRYNQEKADLNNRYNLAYGQYRDSVSDWENQRDYANSDYWNKYNADYADYQNQFNYWNQMAQQENAAFYNDRDYAYSLAMSMIKAGTMPSTDILDMAGISSADAKTLAKKYGYGASSGGGSSSKKSSGTSSSGSKNTGATTVNLPNVGTLATSAVTAAYNALKSQSAADKLKNKATGK